MGYTRHQLALIAAGFCLDCELAELPKPSPFRRCLQCRHRKWKVSNKRIVKREYDRERYQQRVSRSWDVQQRKEIRDEKRNIQLSRVLTSAEVQRRKNKREYDRQRYQRRKAVGEF